MSLLLDPSARRREKGSRESSIEATKMNAELIEKLAELEHEQWLSWARAVWDEVSAERREKWSPSMVPYADLSEKAKEQDREWARRAAAIVGTRGVRA
jgi:hypothetical protein